MDISKIKFDERGLVPAIAQDVYTKRVLMLAYMNKESIEKTLDEKEVVYYSRSKDELWKKGETSGNTQKLIGMSYDCDGDSLLLTVEQIGVACHTGEYSCFFNEVVKLEEDNGKTLDGLYSLLKDRKWSPVEGSYTSYLFEKGIDKILKKIGEESAEVIIASKNNDKEEIINEISDLVYHALVLMVDQGVEINDIKRELEKRRE